MPEKNSILGLVGENGCGKSTALLILIGNIIPNLGNWKIPETTRKKLSQRYRGTSVQNYLQSLDKGLRVSYKEQNIQDLRNNEMPSLILSVKN